MEHLVLATYPITNNCNISCPWCAAHLSSQPLFNIWHVLGALGRIGKPIHGVALTGGEPFNSPKILEIKAELEANGYRVFAITNGTLHDHIFEFCKGGTLDIALSVHNPSLFPEWIVEKKQALLDECRRRDLKIMAGLFSVDNEEDIKAAVEYILANRDGFHTATISTVYRRDVPAMKMSALIEGVTRCLPQFELPFITPGKSVVNVDGFSIVLRRSPTKAEYDESYNIPGCMFLAWNGEFMPVALAQYANEEVLQ
ncbi:MAG: hypothetical protein FD174_2572 [Geobacteraceae bacterium]|nr:MAG: hypothetical protein FD174_2572 [Geobacteraceae bacterium]